MKNKIIIGVDVGGTKILAAAVNFEGKILHQEKKSSPAKALPKEIQDCLADLVKELTGSGKLQDQPIAAIGIGIPGIVDSERNEILTTPNINLSNYPLAKEITKIFDAPTFLGNDVNLGLLGEQWLGAAQNAKNVVGIFPGTGIGGAIILDGKLFCGSTGAAAEIGHMIIIPDGPMCSCGNRGCLEALAGRWAIERDIREAVTSGTKTIIAEITEGDFSVIKSKTLKKALKEMDPLAVEIMSRAAQHLGLACISIRHILNPEIILFGGGVMEACGDFMMPIIENTFHADPFFEKIDHCRIARSKLEDNAVILGAAALAKEGLKN